jgi:ABC-type polysaccharide/polyol phosphate transport system ATPase subunit
VDHAKSPDRPREIAVSTRSLGKRYKIYRKSYHRVAETILLGKRRMHEELWALRDVDLDIEQGIALGIVGSNGAGKSTFLKILTGTSTATRGAFHVNGRVSSLLELGAGFHMDFTGRDNIYLNASVLGWSREEVEARYDDVVAFSELGDFIDRPVRIYSTGMVMRLGFSVAITMNPDVLIIDEVLAVGDQHFQKKCIERIHRFKEDGKTILFCSHSLYHVRQICDRAIWIKNGRVEMDGHPIDVTNEYSNYERKLLRNYLAERKSEAPSDKKLFPHITKVELSRAGESTPVRNVKTGDDVDVRIWYEVPDSSVDFNIAVGITRADDIQCFGSSARHEGMRDFRKSGFAIFRIRKLRLLAGEFTVSAFITDENTTMIYDQKVDEIEFKVDYKGWEIGLFLPDREWVFDETP